MPVSGSHGNPIPVQRQAGEWDSAVVGAIGGIVRHVCMPNHDTRLGGFKGKQLLRQALALSQGGGLAQFLWSFGLRHGSRCAAVSMSLLTSDHAST